MSEFDLPAISADAHPAFTDQAACAAWLAELPLVNVAPSQIRLLDALRELNRYQLPVAERITILETLRDAVYFVQEQQLKKLVGKPLPLTQVERGIFVHVVNLWQELRLGYQRCLAEAAPGKENQTALICQRGLDCIASDMFDHYRIYQAFPDANWLALHQLYREADESNEIATPVSDSADKADTSCAEVYVRALLFALANPNEQPQRQLAQIRRWLDAWAQHVPLRRVATEDKSLPQLLLDSSAAAGAYREVDAKGRSPSAWLDVSELARALKRCVVLLRKGEPPASLGLGEDCSMPGVEKLLVLLFRLWCEGQNGRAQTRRRINAKAKTCGTISSMHFHISGAKPFRQPGRSSQLSRQERDEIATFGHTSTRLEDAYADAGGYATEDWLLLEESLSGLRIARPAASSGGRYALTQLIAVQPSDAKNFMVGMVRWIRTDEDETLNLGVHIVPGVPQAVAVRATGINAQMEKFIPALYCPALATLSVPASLILPPGWYRPKRVLEVYSGSSELLLLSAVLERGSDFERVAIEPAR